MRVTIIPPEQVIIFCLRTGQNRLNYDLNRKLHAIPFVEANQDSGHILNACKKNHGTLRNKM